MELSTKVQVAEPIQIGWRNALDHECKDQLLGLNRVFDNVVDRVAIGIGVKLAKQYSNGGVAAEIIMVKHWQLLLKIGGMESVTTSARKTWQKYRGWLWIPFVYLAISYWDIALPTVTVHYPENGKGELRYIWNVQHRIYKGGMQPGGGAVDNGFLFPDDDFFMEISWWSKSVRPHCVNITPKWPNTDIYLDANGDIDLSEGSGTDSDRLKQCITDTASP